MSNERILDSLRMKWDEGDSTVQKTKYLAIYTTHFQEWFLGWTEDGNKELILLTQASAKIPENLSSRLISITEKKAQTGKYFLSFVLIDESVYDVYLKLCEDLIEQLREIKDTSIALKVVLERFRLWQKMLEKKRESDSVYKGLLGELIMIHDLINEGNKPIDVINAWTGPEFTEQDFVFPSKWYEVKAVTSGAMVVTINSAGQLDHPGDGWLCIFLLDKENPKTKDSISVKSYLDSIKKMLLHNDPSAIQLLEDKLIQFEYFLLVQEDAFWFKHIRTLLYKVTDDFPKLTHEIKRMEMQSIKYNLNIVALEKWREK